jgi:hypothetical protein
MELKPTAHQFLTAVMMTVAAVMMVMPEMVLSQPTGNEACAERCRQRVLVGVAFGDQLNDFTLTFSSHHSVAPTHKPLRVYPNEK